MNIVVLFLVIFFAIVSICVLFPLTCGNKELFAQQYSNYLTTVGHPRFPGDYMDYAGEVPSEGGYVLESALDNSYSNENLCQECMNNCVGLAEIHGASGKSLELAKIMCQERCHVECNPNSY